VLSQQTALLQAILDDPDDDALRLVFADWCEENGQADRAEFIRLQLQRDRDANPSAREKALLGRHASEWFAPPPGWELDQDYEVGRGLPWAVFCGYQDVHDHQEPLARWPITRLRLSLHKPEHARLLAGAPLLARVRELDLSYCKLADEGATFLARHPHLPRLRHLDLRGNGITSAGLRALIESEHRGTIESLVLCANRVTGDDACALLASGRWTNLTELDLWNTGLGDAGVARLAACPALALLTTLVLNCNGITDEGAVALAASPHVRNLRTLSLATNALTSACADVLIASPHLRGLKLLRLTDNVRIHWRKRRQLKEHFGDRVTFEWT
jgi:uncharacterized protein (TIGR02996 family)